MPSAAELGRKSMECVRRAQGSNPVLHIRRSTFTTAFLTLHFYYRGVGVFARVGTGKRIHQEIYI